MKLTCDTYTKNRILIDKEEYQALLKDHKLLLALFLENAVDIGIFLELLELYNND